MGKREITQAQWTTVMGYNPSAFPGHNLPVDNVSWDDAKILSARSTEKSESTAIGFPCDAELEYCVRPERIALFSLAMTFQV
ncbi:MAG: SUMF1/EgtB/PvdO family nonheme iron enzyme [Deltaproteobacteria bacterium]|nr:SUMF1/EgtB/PvdO family nonheme iron enzyme [Deltaproteobacteria bacterium]